MSSTPTSKARTVEEALTRVKAMVDATAVAVAEGFHLEPDKGEPVGCEDASGNDVGTITAPYNLKFALPEGTDLGALFDRARTYWRRHGYNVSDVDLKIFDPRMHATQGDYELTLHVVPSQHMAYLGGDTPCLPEAKKT